MADHPQSGASAPGPRIIALTGFMGAGKTCVGRLLASHLAWAFVDLDQEIELRESLRITDLFARDGEQRFRQIEADTLRSILEQLRSHTVIALGGGTFVQPGNAALLLRHGSQVAFLDAPVEHLLQRCRVGYPDGNHNHRPLAADPDAFRALHAQRLPRYRTAQLTIQTSGKSIQQLATEIAAAFQLTVDAL